MRRQIKLDVLEALRLAQTGLHWDQVASAPDISPTILRIAVNNHHGGNRLGFELAAARRGSLQEVGCGA